MGLVVSIYTLFIGIVYTLEKELLGHNKMMKMGDKIYIDKCMQIKLEFR